MTSELAYVRENLSVVREILTAYGTVEKAASSLTCRQQELRKYYEAKNLRFPAPAALLSVMMSLSDEKQRYNFRTAEQVAVTHQVYVVPTEENPKVAAHLRVDRASQVQEIVPADRVAQMTAPFEKQKPGITKFVGDLINLFDFSGPVLRPYGESSQFDNSRVAPGYNYASLVLFAQTYGPKLVVGKAAAESMSQLHAALVQRLSYMVDYEYLDLQSNFYVLACKLTPQGPGYALRADAPIRQVGHAISEGVPYFRFNPAIPSASRSALLYRQSQWQVNLPLVPDTKRALKQLTIDRSWRGEDKGRYSGLTRTHATGGDLPIDRMEVCSALSLVLPLLHQGKNVHLQLKSVAHIQDFEDALCQYQFDNDTWSVTYDASPSQLQEIFGSQYADYLRPDHPDYTTVSMVSGRMPSFSKTEDVDQKWSSLFPASIPQAPYIVVTKVPPVVADEYNVFYFNSAHAFDFAVSSEPTLSVAIMTVDVLPHVVRTKYAEEVRPRLTTADMLKAQYVDNRRKLSFYLEMGGPRYDPRMNLWIPEPKVVKAKKDLLVPDLVQGAQLVPPIDFSADAPPVLAVAHAAPPALDPNVLAVDNFD